MSDGQASRGDGAAMEPAGAALGGDAREPLGCCPRLLGLGTAAPQVEMTQADAVRFAAARCCDATGQARLMRALYRMTHVERRGSALLDDVAEAADGDRHADFFPEPVNGDRGPTTAARMAAYARLAPPLACRAAGAALADAALDADRVTHLVTVSCTGFRSPGVDLELIRRLGLRPTVQRVNVGFMGCHGAMNGLATARALATSEPGARVLLCCVELCSLHFQYGWDEQQLVANALFADGAGAAVIGSGPASDADARTPGRGGGGGAAYEVVDTASCVLPDSADQMTWEIDDHGFIMTLSPQVPGTLTEHVRPWLNQWLDGVGLRVEQVDGWVVHPGGPRILTAVREALQLPGDGLAASEKILRERGNMSSPTVLFILQELERQRGPLRHCVLLSFGPGLTSEAALLRSGT